MTVVAVVLILMAVATGVLIVSGSVGGVRIDVANFQLTTSSAAMFWTGVIATIALAAGVYLMTAALRRARRQRREARELARDPGRDQSGFTAGADRPNRI
jgi:TRAP-type C4-dicarboxylate transport system permease small subunit